MLLNRWIAVMSVFSLSGCLGAERSLDAQELTLDSRDAERLLIDVNGDLLVEGVEGLDRIEFTYALMTERALLAEDDAALEAFEVALARDEDGRIRVQATLDGAPFGYYVDVRIRAPARMRLDVHTGAGSTWIWDFAELDLLDESGDIEIEHIAGSVHVEDGSGSLLIDGAGPTFVQDESGDVNVRNVSGSLEIDDESGDIAVAQVTGIVSLVDASGDIDVVDCDSDLNITDASGSIHVDRIEGRVSIRDESGDIVVGEVGQLVILANESGDLSRL